MSDEEVAMVLESLLEEIKDRVDEAYELVSQHGSQPTVYRAKSYWYASMRIALDKEHDFLAGSMCTLQDTIDEFYGEDD